MRWQPSAQSAHVGGAGADAPAVAFACLVSVLHACRMACQVHVLAATAVAAGTEGLGPFVAHSIAFWHQYLDAVVPVFPWRNVAASS